MKKVHLIIIMFLSIFIFNVSATNINLYKNLNYKKNDEKILTIMEKYHKKYGNKEVNLRDVYYTIHYYATKYDIDLIYALTFFAIESGYTYECKSSYSAVGIGQVTKMALSDYNSWFNEDVSFSCMNDKATYDYNIKVALGYLRLCWDKYRIIECGTDLMKAYNIGITNLSNIKKGITTRWIEVNGRKVDYWKYASEKYSLKFQQCFWDFFNAMD